MLYTFICFLKRLYLHRYKAIGTDIQKTSTSHMYDILLLRLLDETQELSQCLHIPLSASNGRSTTRNSYLGTRNQWLHRHRPAVAPHTTGAFDQLVLV